MFVFAETKKGGDKSAVVIAKSVRQLGCVMQDAEPPKSSAFSRKGTRVLGLIRRVHVRHLKNSELEPQFPKIPRSVELCPEVTLFRIVCCIHRAKIIFITNDGCSSNGYEIKTTRMCRTSSRRNISLEAYGIFAFAFAQ